MSDALTDISKFLSYVLRHEPHSIGLTLDPEGWAEISALMGCAHQVGRPLNAALIQAVVQGNDKRRFAISDDGRYIRAVQGHSIPSVAIHHRAKVPPVLLYHGTATRFLDAIRAQGLQSRQRHHVHLSDSWQTAATVGQRYGTPIVLQVEALQMHQAGLPFFQADNGVWLTQCVPPQFIRTQPPDNFCIDRNYSH
jgi:putative RNA 2'-phosphotransferase